MEPEENTEVSDIAHQINDVLCDVEMDEAARQIVGGLLIRLLEISKQD